MGSTSGDLNRSYLPKEAGLVRLEGVDPVNFATVAHTVQVLLILED